MSEKKIKIKRGDNRLALKAGIWYVANSFVAKGISFITTPIFARLMTTEDYGEFSNFASWQAVLIVITGAELYHTLSRAYYDYKDDYNSYVSSIAIAGMLFTLAIYILCLAFQDIVLKVVAIPEQYIHLLFGMLLFTSCKQVYIARERTMYRYKSATVLSFISLTIPTLISIGLVYILPNADGLSSRLYGFYVPSILIGVICMGMVLVDGRFSFKPEHCKYAFALSLPLVAHYLTSYILTSTNTIIAKNMIGSAAASVVSIANSTIHILTIFFQAVSGAVTTWLMDNLVAKNVENVRKGSLLYVSIIAFTAVGVMLFAPEVIRILGGSKYIASVELIPFFALGIFFQATATLFTIILTYDKNVKLIALVSSIVAVISILTKVLLVNKWGSIALSYVNAAAFFMLLVADYFLVKRAGYIHYLDRKRMFIVVCFVVAIAFLCTLLYNNNKVRFAVIGILFITTMITVILNRNSVYKWIKRFMKS